MRRRDDRWIVMLVAVVAMSAAARAVSLIEAVKKGDKTAVVALLQQRADVNARDIDGTAALHWAAQRDDRELAALLIRAGADVGAVNRYGVTPLSLACVNGSAPMIELLLKAGANADAALPEGETALLTAARTGDSESVRVLLAHGATVNARETWRGQNALMWAAAEGHLAASEVLVAHGADVNATSIKGYTALMLAARAGHRDVVSFLLDSGARVNDTQAEGASAMIIAIHNAHYELAASLLDRGADPNGSTAGYSPLHLAVQTRNLDLDALPGPVPTGTLDSLDLIKALLAKGADVNARMTKPFLGLEAPVYLPLAGATPFLLAAKAADVPLMRVLLASGADPRAATAARATPLMAAAGVGYAQGKSPGSEGAALEAVKLTLELGGDVNAADAAGFTALHGAAIRGANSLVSFLVAQGARLDPTNKNRQTPLMLAEDGGVGNVSTVKKQPQTAALLRELMSK